MGVRDDWRLLGSAVRDYRQGAYRRFPRFTAVAMIAALAYVLFPLDLIGDFIPFVGYLDDATVVGFCVALARKDLRAYRQWKESAHERE